MTEHLLILNSKTPEETSEIAKKLAGKFHIFPKYSMIYLQGDLGSGKTFFVRGFCESFNLENQVSSPSYSILNEYRNEKICIKHMDLYRLSHLEELDEIGFEEIISGADFVFIEWPELAAEWFREREQTPNSFREIQFIKSGNELNRKLKISIQGRES